MRATWWGYGLCCDGNVPELDSGKDCMTLRMHPKPLNRTLRAGGFYMNSILVKLITNVFSKPNTKGYQGINLLKDCEPSSRKTVHGC